MTLNKFSKSHRLLTSEDFLYLKNGSFCLKAPQLIAYAKNSRLAQSETRIGISVSKRVGNSFTRNRLKRIIRENFRLSEVRNLGLDVLFVVGFQLYKTAPTEAEAEAILKKSLSLIFSLLQKRK